MSFVNKPKSKEHTILPSNEFSMTNEYREAINFFEKFEKYELQENISWYSTNWLLSNDDIKLSLNIPPGLCKSLPTINYDKITVLYPCTTDEYEEFLLDYREVYQLIREVTVGIFGCNQIPSIELEGNYDRSTYCELPPAYINTRTGQHLIEVDYTMKSLWFGAHFPLEKRKKWSEKWKSNLAVNLNGIPETKRNILEEFINAGQINVTELSEYSSAYNDYVEKLKRESLYKAEIEESFKKNRQKLGMKMNFFVEKICHEENVILFKSDYKIETVLRTIVQDLDPNTTEKISKILQLQRDLLRENIENRSNIKKRIFIFKLICGLIPLLVGLKKRMKIPDLRKVMNPLIGDEIVTEKELPPLMPGPNYPNVLFNQSEYFSLHGGVQFNLSTPEIDQLPKDLRSDQMKDEIQRVSDEASLIAQSESTYVDKNPLRTVTDSVGNRYYVIPISLDTYYNQSPKSPNWVRAISEETVKLQKKRLPLSENALFEQYKRFYGLTVAMQNKDIMEGLRTCSKRGLVAMIQSLCQRCSVTRVSKQDNLGWSLMHHAAINNHVHLIGALVLQSQDVNVRRYNSITETSPTPLHTAVVTGSLASVACLVGCNANLYSADKAGWMSVHCAAYCDQVIILDLLIRQDPKLMDVKTKNKLCQSAILLAAGSGSIGCVQLLIRVGASISQKDADGKGVIHMAVLSFRNQIIEYFIDLNLKRVPVWPILKEMLLSKDPKFIQSTVECLEYLTKFSDKYWRSILEFGLVPPIIDLLNTDDMDLLLTTTSLLCNICVQQEIQVELEKTEIIKISIGLFEMKQLLLKSQLSFVLAHICKLPTCQKLFASLNGHICLESLIKEAATCDPSTKTLKIDVAVNGVDAVTSLCRDNVDNQNLIMEHTTIDSYLINFVSIRNQPKIDNLLASASLAISSIVKGNNANQTTFINKNVVKPLADLLEPKKNVSVKVTAANAIEEMCYGNQGSRESFLAIQTEKLLIHLLKIWTVGVREQAIRSLWSLAGSHITGQRFIADKIGASLLIELIMTKSQELQSIGCIAITALCREMKLKQDQFINEGGIQPLVRLLRQASSSYTVLETTVETIGTMCLGIAHCNNYLVQTEIANEDAIQTLVQLYNRDDINLKLKIEISYTLAALTLNHKENEKQLKKIYDFCDLLCLMKTIKNRVLFLRCLTSLAAFGFNNTVNQFAIKERGGIDYRYFQIFLESDDPVENIQAAFNIVILAKDVSNHDQVTITANAVQILVEQLQSSHNHIIILTASLMASLCHTRAGIPDAFVSLGTVECLLQLLHTTNDLVKSAAAVALGYLSFNGTAARIMLKECRKDYSLFDLLYKEIRQTNSKMSTEFVEAYDKTEKVGLPYKYLECNGGYPIIPSPSRIRIKSAKSRNRSESANPNNEEVIESSKVARKRPFTAQVTGINNRFN